MTPFLSGLAVSMAALALWTSWLSGIRARQALATIDDLINLVGQLADQREAAPVSAACDGAVSVEPHPASTQSPTHGPLAENPPHEMTPRPDPAESGPDTRITPQLRAVVPDLYGQGTPLVEIARRSGLSRGEVKMLIALDQRSRREAR